jgi:TRAP-type C4-dicarboxylate transport system permease small subunit
MATAPRDQRSIRELVDQLSVDVRRLVRAEIGVVRAEVAERARRLGAGVALLLVAAVFTLIALATATATAILALALVVSTWLAALIVTAALLVLAVIMLLTGLRLLRRGAPMESVDAIKEDVAWLRTRARSGAT